MRTEVFMFTGRRLSVFLLTLGMFTGTALVTNAVADDGPGNPPPRQDGPPNRDPNGGPPPGGRAPGAPGSGGFHLIPRFAEEKLELTADQQKQVADLEAETK